MVPGPSACLALRDTAILKSPNGLEAPMAPRLSGPVVRIAGKRSDVIRPLSPVE